jgi:hypothetical protein
MQCKVSFITRKTKGGITRKDEVCSGEVLRFGRSTDNEIYLSDFRVSLHHATLHERQGNYHIEAEAGADLRVNGNVCSSARLNVGDVVAVGPYDITVCKSDSGEDLQLDIELARPLGDDLQRLQEHSVTTLAATGASKRRWSWALFIFITALFLALPITAFYVEPVRDALSDAPVTADLAWKSGDYAAAHKFFGNDCKACHQDAFVTVRDKACITCHTETTAHADPEKFDMPSLNETRCATCHKEHNGEHALVRQDEQLCGDCHRDLGTQAETKLKNASDFGHHHAEFSATLFRYSAQAKEFTTERVALDDESALVETSNLKFNHLKHLDPEGVDSPNAPNGKKVMACADCHHPEPGGLGMQAINMERDCIECHTLEFEPDNPQRVVPHGKLEQVLYNLTEYYGNLALKGGYEDPKAPRVVRNRRRPGQKLSRAERKEAFDWAASKALEVGADLFEGRVCSTCHEVTRVREDYPPKWDIAPVKLADTWLPKAAFAHKNHATMDCADCHDVAKSEESSDVLIPGIENCRQCHAGTESVTNRLESTCVDCHGFHIAEGHALGNREGMVASDKSGTSLRMEKNK